MAWRHPKAIFEVEATTDLVVSEDELLEHVRQDAEGEDIAAYVRAATGYVEEFTQRLLLRRNCKLRLPCLPSMPVPIELRGGQVSAIDDFEIVGQSQDLAGAQVIGDSPALMIYGDGWPAIAGETAYPVTISYAAGYETPESVPEPLRHAVKQFAAGLYALRESQVIGTSLVDNPAPERLMKPYRIMPR